MFGKYFGMLCKSHLLVKSSHAFDTSQHFSCLDFTFYPWGGLVTISWSKTIQFHERVVLLPLPFIPDSPLCPVTAVKRVIPGVVPLPLPFISDSPLCPVMAPFISDSPLCPVMAVKGVIPGVVLLPLPFISDCPLRPVTAVEWVIPGAVLLPLPFKSDSPLLPCYRS